MKRERNQPSLRISLRDLESYFDRGPKNTKGQRNKGSKGLKNGQPCPFPLCPFDPLSLCDKKAFLLCNSRFAHFESSFLKSVFPVIPPAEAGGLFNPDLAAERPQPRIPPAEAGGIRDFSKK